MSACLAVRDHDKLDLKSKESDKSKPVFICHEARVEGDGGGALPSSGLLGVCH